MPDTSTPGQSCAVASPEFLALCQTQLALMATGMPISLGALYLAEQRQDLSPDLQPIAVWPPQADAPPLGFFSESGGLSELPASAALSDRQERRSLFQQVIPLRVQERVLGLLIVRRASQEWSTREVLQLEAIARSLSLARLLEQRNQALSGQQEQQRLWLETVLHQLKNPLTALKTFGKLLQRRITAEDPNRPLVDSLLRESDRLQGLLGRLEPPAQEPPSLGEAVAPRALLPAGDSRCCELATVLAPLLSNAAAIAPERQLTLVIPPLGNPTVGLRPEALTEIVGNLLDNALKYTPAGGRVGLLCQRRGDVLALGVWDDGPGIPAADQGQLFQRHFRGVQARGELPGSGLGLAIARELAQQAGGDLVCYSPARRWHPDLPDRGCAFVLSLPPAAPATAPPSTRP